MMPYFLSLVVLAAFTGDVFAQCDTTALAKCVADAAIAASGGSNDMCASFDGMKQCVEMYRPNCESQAAFNSYANNLNTMVPLCGGGSGGGCDMQALSGCLTIMQSISSGLGGDSQPSGQALQQVCDAYSTFQACIQKLPPACMESMKTSGMGAGMPQMDQYCGNDGCDMVGIQQCMVPLSGKNNLGSDSALSTIVQVASECGTMETALSCLDPKLEGCKDNDLMKQTTFVIDKMRMMINFVCKEKKDDIMSVAECASKPEAMPHLSKCESDNQWSSNFANITDEELCTQVTTMNACITAATKEACTETETNTITSLLSQAVAKMYRQGKNPCGATGGAVGMVSSIWVCVTVVIVAMFM